MASIDAAPELPRLLFYSYSRADSNPYLEQFFTDFGKRVAGVLGLGEAKVYYLDTKVPTGADWLTTVGLALQSYQVLLCVYSPNYFTKDVKHQYCGKEVDAFLRRHGDLTYEEPDADGSRVHRFQRPPNILPVLWYAEADLKAMGLPPPLMRAVTYTLNEIEDKTLRDLYVAKGLERITQRRTADYFDIIFDLAGAVRDRSRQLKLPPLPYPPSWEELQNAFWKAEREESAHKVKPGPHTAAGPVMIAALVVRPQGTRSPPWKPYGGEQTVQGLVLEVTCARRLQYDESIIDFSTDDFATEVAARLDQATLANNSPLLLVDPACLEARGALARLGEAIKRNAWRGGVLLPGASQALAEQFTAQLGLSLEEQQRVSVRAPTTVAEFPVALGQILEDTAARVVKHGLVQAAKPEIPGPDVRPTITHMAKAPDVV